MPYTINRTDGTTLVTLADGVVDTTTDLNLVGRNVAGYGETQNENFVKLLENFASTTTPPSKPLVGQLWFDKDVDVLRPAVFDGVKWRQVAILDVGNTAPGSRKEGDLWWDADDNKLYAWSNDGDEHVLIGPEGVTGFGITKWVSMKVTDTDGNDHAVAAGYVDGSIYAIIADDNFTIDQAETPITGFTDLHKGITLEGTTANDQSTATKYVGTATDSDKLKGRDGDTYANLADAELVTGNYKFRNDPDGVNFGPNDELVIKHVNNNTKIWATGTDSLAIGVNYAGSGQDKTVMGFSGKDVLPGVDEEFNFGSPSLKWRNIYADSIFANVVGDIVGDTVGTNTGNVVGNVTGNVTGNVQTTGGTVLVDLDNQRFEGTAAFVDDGVLKSTAQTITAAHNITGNFTFRGNNTFMDSANRFRSTATFEGTSEHYNGNVSKGTIGKGAIPSQDSGRAITDLTIDSVTIKDSTIQGSGTVIKDGTIQQVNINNSAIGVGGIVSNVKSTQFTDSGGRSFSTISKDPTFSNADNDTVTTTLATKQYIDNKISGIVNTITFHLDTKGLDTNGVKAQLERLAPAENFANGTEARILGSHYYANHGTDSRGNPRYFRKYGVDRVLRRGIGYIGGRYVNQTTQMGSATDLLNAKTSITGYKFVKRGVGGAQQDLEAITTNIPANNSQFFNLLENNTLNGWMRITTDTNGLHEKTADYLGFPGAQGARVVCFQNGVVIGIGFDVDGILFDGLKDGSSVGRNAFVSGPFTVGWNAKVPGATPNNPADQSVEFYTIDYNTLEFPGAWVYNGTI